MPTTWRGLIAVQLAVVAALLAGFVLVERAAFADADASVLARLHLVRGATVGVSVTVLAAVYAKQEVARSAEQEQRWFSFLNGLPVAVFALDAQGSPAFANDAALEMLGKGILPAVADELSIVYPSYIAGTDTPYPPERMPIVRALAGERSIVDDVELDRDGVRVPIEAWASPIRDDDGDVLWSMAVFFDISARKRLEEEQEARRVEAAARKQAQHERETQARFIDHAAHQLYTPLTPLKLQLRKLAASTDADVGPMQRSVDRIHGLISQILRVAKMGARPEHLHVSPHPAKALFEHAALRMQGLAEERGIQIRVDAPHTAHGDQDLLLDALVNLLHNAIKFSNEGSEVRLRSRMDDDATVLVVEDDGRGWTPGDERRWFEAFSQGEEVADQEVGWGLGLYVARNLTEAHGGTLTAHSDGPGKGARFELRLPTP